MYPSARAWALVVFPVVLLGCILSWPQPAMTRDGGAKGDDAVELLFDRVKQALRVLDTGTSAKLLDEFDRDLAPTADQEQRIAAAGLRYRVAAAELGKQANAPAEARAPLVANLQKRFTDFRAIVEQRISASTTPASEGRKARDRVGLQRVALDYARHMRSANKFAEAMSALELAKGLCPRPGQAMPLKAVIRKSEGGKEETIQGAAAVAQAMGFLAPQAVDQEILTTAEAQFTQTPTEEARATLLKALNGYVADYPTDPYAGATASRAMELEGKLDLDRWVSVFEKCADKNHPQYVYSTLGLAGELVRSGRAAQAMPYLNHIKNRGIEQSRMAELYYVLGRASLQLKANQDAIEYFTVVKKMSKSFDVDPLIRMASHGENRSVEKLLEPLRTTEPVVPPPPPSHAGRLLGALVAGAGILVAVVFLRWRSRRRRSHPTDSEEALRA